MRSTNRLWWTIWIWALAAPASLCAQPQAPAWVSWQFQGENDAIGSLSGTDEFYTQGLRFTIQRNPKRLSERWRKLGNKLWEVLYPDQPVQVGLGIEIGHHIFTPGDLEATELIEDDRPYAGWLYGGIVLTLIEDSPGEDDIVQQTLEVQLGIVGPEAGAEWLQTEFHEVIDSQPPLGWDNQLPFEIGLNAFYTWRKRRVLWRYQGAPSLDVVPHLGGALGTMQIYAAAGATARLGRNISGFPLSQNNNTLNLLPGLSRPTWEGYIFVGAEGRAIARNIFLDGSTFRDSHSVDKENFVFDLKAGFSLRYRSCRLSYTFVRRSREFSPLPQGRIPTDGRHDYGSINFTVERSF